MPLLTNNASQIRVTTRSRFYALVGFWPLALSAMLALLVVVAILQYRWTNEATAASEMRIGAELESQMMKWHGDLYGEFSAICTAMQVGPDSGARDTWSDYLERYVEWNNAPPHEALPNVYRNPDLVQNVYIWDTNLDSKPQLFRLNAETKKIEASKIPGNLQTLLLRLRAHSATLSTSLRVWQLPAGKEIGSTDGPAVSGPTGVTPIPGWQFDENVPAIVHPIFQRDGRSLTSRSPVDWMVIVVDLNALRKRILPELATRYFGGLEGLDYRIAVVAKGRNPEIIYSSDPGFGSQDVADADASLQIFGLPEGDGQDKLHASKEPRSLQSAEWRNMYGTIWFPVIQYESNPAPWILAIQRRSGPLQAAIQRVRAKNLAVSALVLLLLAGSMGLLTIAGMRAQKFNKLQMDFVASVSHELRTPLTVIFSAGENIKDGVIRDKGGLAEYGSIVMGQSRQLMDYVDRILLFASIGSGKDRYSIRPLQVAEVLERVRKNMVTLIIEESCVIEENVDSGLPYVLGDLRAVCSCLENLITNAIKYGGSDRRIGLSASLQITPAGKRVAISVQDRGIGIQASDLKQIFEPFYRSHEATAAQIPGTGLGLSLCKHLAEAMGGSLTVQSEVGVGSTFTLFLLTADAAQPDLVGASASKERGDKNE